MARIFDKIDQVIMRSVYYHGIPMTIGEISTDTRISWITVKKHLQKLVGYGLVKKIETETRQTPKMIWNFNEFGNLGEISA